MNTLVSIIVPCYNHANFLGEALQSVLNQTYTNWECIIVNDGSPDNAAQIAEQWAAKDSRFQYLEKENGGLSSARNAGIKIGKGEFILPLDADDLIHENFLTTLVPVLENNQNLAIASCYSKFFFGSRNNIIHELKPKGTNYHALLYENILIATSLYRKQCWEAVGGYDETMKKGFEDWEFWIAITKTGWEFKIVEEFLFYYRKQKQSMLIDTLQNHRLANMEYVYNKHKEIYVDKYETTLKYLFYLINKHSTSEQKIKLSLEFKIAKVLAKPLKWFKK
ncbi:glycosyltransferase family 2 protein [Tamlana sp. 62-3]|uniref:Glycosyltransferase family 2 protein n=1 Tax=Neotamlana sargassicola TaxID=2883125 RepID=A0A9X1L7P6_9FLAO|nr:glycosyltransferase family A protein [Tamlana sargassicola]MCB4808729.1 glycosyltransferase family 2 protein [Tamlana sargassicola]